MFRKLLNRKVVYFLLYICLTITNISMATDVADSSTGRRRCVWAERMLLRELGLKEDVNDTVIIQLLDMADKRILATALIRYRRISSATPKLLQIVNDDQMAIPARITAADALCDFGNREWMPTIKALSTDPNGIIARTPFKIKVAGLLARAGDYSQFEVVATRIDDNKRSVRYVAIQALGNFRHKTEPVTDLAAVLLTFTAISDPVPWLRELAIYSLEKIAKIKPEITSRVINALEANSDSPDKNLRRVCRVKLTRYGRKLKAD